MNFKFNAMNERNKIDNKNRLVLTKFKNTLENAFTVADRIKNRALLSKGFR